MKAAVCLAFVALAVSATTAAAALPTCQGHYEIVRTSTIKPGQMELFAKAVRDNQDWYKTHGFTDRIELGRVLMQPGMVGGPFSPTTVLTIHTNLSSSSGDEAARAVDDAEWKNFVAEYAGSSHMDNQSIICVSGPLH